MSELFLLLSAAAFLSTLYHVQKFSFRKAEAPSRDLPTVSFLMPARNETHAIARAVTNALNLEYPKLEIIVLDDESGDNTSEKIRSFAQDGVRFLAGQPLPPEWIGKNFACQQLSEAASGDYLVFSDIDVLPESQTILRLIRHMEADNLDGVSVLPKQLSLHRVWVPFEPLGSWWLMMVPWELLRRSPVSGSFMIVRHSAYQAFDGHSTFKGQVLPEFALAKQLNKRGKYRFYLADGLLKLTTLKKPGSFNETRIRTLYPLLGRSVVISMMLFALGTWLLLTPLLQPNQLTYGASAVFLGSYFLVAHRLKQFPFLSTLTLPLALLWELVLLLVSIYRYQSQRVTWKQRPIQPADHTP